MTVYEKLAPQSKINDSTFDTIMDICTRKGIFTLRDPPARVTIAQIYIQERDGIIFIYIWFKYVDLEKEEEEETTLGFVFVQNDIHKKTDIAKLFPPPSK